MLEFSHRAMACDFVVLVRDANQDLGHRSVADLVLDALESVDEIERRLTIYDANSEISTINAAAGKNPVRVSATTFAVLQHAVRLSEITGGAFDITAGPLIDAWGFTSRQGRKPTAVEITAARDLVGMGQMRLCAEQGTVELLEAGMRINLGAIGKGDAIDHLSHRLKSVGIKDFLIHAGQSSVLACGNQFEPEDPDDGHGQARQHGWKVGIAHPTKPNRRIAGIWLLDAALATSGSGKQFFHHQGKRHGHVIDPRTGQPAGDMLSLSIVTPQAVDADALATGLFVNGRDAARAFAETNDSIPLIMVSSGTRQDSVDVQTVGHWNWVDPPLGTQK